MTNTGFAEEPLNKVKTRLQKQFLVKSTVVKPGAAKEMHLVLQVLQRMFVDRQNASVLLGCAQFCSVLFSFAQFYSVLLG